MPHPITQITVNPPIPTPEELARIKEFQTAQWPLNLYRFALIKRKVDGIEHTFRAITWDPTAKCLHVQRVESGQTPDGSRLPQPWSVSYDASFLDEIHIVHETIRRSFMVTSTEKAPPSCLKGLSRRNILLYALLYFDPIGNGDPIDYIFNDNIIVCSNARSTAIQRVCGILEKKPGSYRSYLNELLSKYLWFGGGPAALMNLAPSQGGPGNSRVGVNKNKPGRLSSDEERARDKAAYRGENDFKRQQPVRPSDLEKFVLALTLYWAKDRKSFAETYRLLINIYYANRTKRLYPTYRMFMHHAPGLIQQHGLKHIRLGHRLSAQYNDARVGQAGDITQGVIEILDVDGFVAKLFVAAKVKDKIEPVAITVIFAVSRLSGAVLGYELALRLENAESFRRCVASVFLPKQERAHQLGLDNLPGLLHGNIDGIFVDNGAGAAEEVLATAIDEMGLMRMLPPGGRGDLKGVGEGLNSIMITLMSAEGKGYTRKSDFLSKDTRRKMRKAPPLPLDDFERLLLKAINQYNLYTKKKRLRTQDMRIAGIGISPKAIFKYTQEERRGDARRKLSYAEVNDKFIPWVPKICRGGLVHFKGPRFFSTELTDFFNENAKLPGKVKNPIVEVKRLSGSPTTLLWRKPDKTVAVLKMVEEDERSFTLTSWKAIELDCHDDRVQGDRLDAASARNRGELSVKSHEKVAAAERGRGNPLASLEGATVKLARKNAAYASDKARGKAEIKAYSIEPTGTATLDIPAQHLDKATQFEADFLSSLNLGN